LLQDTLKKLGFFPQSIASNSNFGPATLKAVKAFQVYYNIAKLGDTGYGIVGPKTRQLLNQLIGQ
jgi:peptidoglycan hydrolase-like protein with peptidoglycan-binding domain